MKVNSLLYGGLAIGLGYLGYNAFSKAAESDFPKSAETSDSIPKGDKRERASFFEWILKEKPQRRQVGKDYSRKVDYLASIYSDVELENGAINAFHAGNISTAQLFAAALNRQQFVKRYQTETEEVFGDYENEKGNCPHRFRRN